jgi:hypothetical protein
MSYERKDIPALIALFKAAKVRLMRGRGAAFLCRVIEEIESPVQWKASGLVRDAIYGYYTLETWARETNGNYLHAETSASLRQIRIQWCDKIIADLREYAK